MAPPQIIRVVDLETTGPAPPAHGVCEVGWQDVALGSDGVWALHDEGGSRLVNPGRPIPPVTMAIHHILDEDVVDAPWWQDVARPLLDPWPRRVALSAHHASFEQKFCTPALTRGADWICTWKCSMRLWPESPSFSNQVLRYWRMPEGLDRTRGLPVHRAFPDSYVTAHHLRDMLNAVGAAQLIEWSKLPGLMPRVHRGPERGRDFRELEEDVLLAFTRDRDEDVRYTAETEVARRHGGGEVRRASKQDLLL